MNGRTPVHELQTKLDAARVEAIENVAARAGEPLENLKDQFQWIALLQVTATAVRELIDAHAVKEGWGGDNSVL